MRARSKQLAIAADGFGAWAMSHETFEPLRRCLLICSVGAVVTVAAAVRSLAFLDTRDLAAVREFYRDSYAAAEDAQPHWTGDTASGVAGETAEDFKQAVLERINWFRVMAGVPVVTGLNQTWNRKAQEAALMMSANEEMNHYPPSSWIYYTAEGSEAARKSNLYLGHYGPEAITRYVADQGSANYAVGHRRWLLYPHTTTMGTGDVPQTRGYLAANAVWLSDPDAASTRPATRDDFVAWPPPGYVPYEVVYPRWSFSYPGADFSRTTITFTRGGNTLAVDRENLASGYAENTIVWIPIDPALPSGSGHFPRPASSVTNRVRLNDVLIRGQSRAFEYVVILFDPHDGPVESPPPVRWQLGRSVRSSPCLATNGTLYVVAGSRLVALSPNSGHSVWERFTGSNRSAPSLGTDGAIYVGMEGTAPGMIAFSPAGNELWRVSTAGYVTASPAIASNGTVIFGTTFGFVEGRPVTEGVLHAVTRTGDELWAFAVGADLESSPAIGTNGLVYVGTTFRRTVDSSEIDGRLCAVDLVTGHPAWSFLADGAIQCSPALGNDGTVYFGTVGGRVFALDGELGTVRWEFLLKGSAQASSPIIGPGPVLYLGTTESRFYALDATLGTKRWSYEADDTFEASGVIGQAGLVYGGARDGRLFALSGATGIPQWRFDSGRVFSTASPVIAMDGTLYIGSEGRWVRDEDGNRVFLEGRLFALETADEPSDESAWPVFGQNPGHTGQMPGGTAPVNLPPYLEVPNDVTTSEQDLFVLELTATDPDHQESPPTIVMLESPEGAEFEPATGLLAWTPTETQGPGAYGFTFAATETAPAEPRLSITNSFTVHVREINQPPEWTPVAPQTVVEGALFTLQLEATDPDFPGNVLAYELVSGPEGLIVDANTGMLSWRPTEAQGPGEYTVAVKVTDENMDAELNRSLTATNVLQVVVTEVNVAPSISPVETTLVHAGTELLVRIKATDPDLPANTLIFDLLEGPLGTSLNRATGELRWEIPMDAAGTTNRVVVQIWDDGEPPLSHVQAFSISTTEPLRVQAVEVASTGSVILRWNTIPGAYYRVQLTEQLNIAPWRNVEPDFLSDGLVMEYEDPGSGVDAARYYRVRAVP